jgi:DNA-binding transcriptional regulator YhcF (GntR family)
MRLWITKNGELPVREQLVRQVLLGILSEDLPAGHKLPSVRALARRHHVHANTVSAAYHDLLQQGWLELRRGSGLYVRPRNTSPDLPGLDRLLTALLQAARADGYAPEEVLERLEHLVRPRPYERLVIAEQDPGMRAILQTEIGEHLNVPIEISAAPDFSDLTKSARSLVVALPTRAAQVRRGLPDGVLFIPLRVRSVPASLEGQSRPGPEVVISIVSQSEEIRHWARAVLIAVGVDPDAICEIDTSAPDWKARISGKTFVVTDVVAARELPPGTHSKVFRIIADSSMEELKQLFCA